jgi:hypothetical protein
VSVAACDIERSDSWAPLAENKDVQPNADADDNTSIPILSLGMRLLLTHR